MKKTILILGLALAVISCNKTTICNDKDCKPGVQLGKKNEDLKCKLSSPELQERKATVLTSLRSKIIETKELQDGYSFKFNGDDKTIDELMDFVKSERVCCDFFSFDLSVTGDTSSVWFSLRGPGDAKKIIKSEMEF